MGEYFEKETFKSWMKENITENPMILTAIDYAPSADVEPVKHGEWDKKPFLIGTSYYCSECGDNFGEPYNYCPNCGAKMDEENGE